MTDKALILYWQCNNIDEFRATLRMPPDVWQDLLTMVDPHIHKDRTNWRESHSSELKLAVTIHYLALGMYNTETTDTHN